MASWPDDLPKQPPMGSWSVQIVDPTVRNTPDRGPPMARRRASIDWEIWTCTYILTKAQWETLRRFWKTTTVYGSGSFEMFNWMDLSDQMTVMFAAAPQVQQIAQGWYSVQCQFNRLPV